jgi:hypothetical protein
MSNFEGLAIDHAQPPSLGGEVWQSLVVYLYNLGTTATSGGGGVHRYVHRLNDLGSDIVAGRSQASISVFMSTIWSREQ